MASQQFEFRSQTTDGVVQVQLLVTLPANQDTVVVCFVAQASRDAGDNFFAKEETRFLRRDAGTVDVSIMGTNTASTGTGATLAATVGPSGDDVRMQWAGNAGETWDWQVNVEVKGLQP